MVKDRYFWVLNRFPSFLKCYKYKSEKQTKIIKKNDYLISSVNVPLLVYFPFVLSTWTFLSSVCCVLFNRAVFEVDIIKDCFVESITIFATLENNLAFLFLLNWWLILFAQKGYILFMRSACSIALWGIQDMSRVWTGCNEERKTIEPMTTFSTEIKKRSESSESQERKTLA